MGIKNIDQEACSGCGICREDCPVDVIQMDKELNKAYIAYPNDCMVCYLCQEMCPEDAIAVSPEVVAKLAFPY